MNKKNTLPSISLIIPIHNNEHTAIGLIKKCELILKQNTSDYEIILIDDKSTDSTADLLKNAFGKNKKIKITFHKKNLGIAGTIKSLYQKANKDYIALFSVDGDWKVTDLSKMLKEARFSQAHIIIGKRKTTNYTTYRRLVSFLYNFLPRILFGVNTHDAGSIKVIRRAAMKEINITSNSIFFEAEFIIKAHKKGFKIGTVPVHYHKKEKKSGMGGKISYVFKSMVDMIKLRANFKN